MIEFTDYAEDRLQVYADLDGVNFRTIYSDQPDAATTVWIDPEGDDRDTLVAIRDLIEEALGDTEAAPDTPGVIRASDISLNEGILRLAAVHGREVEFRYAKGSGAYIEDRRFAPVSVKTTKDGNVVVTGPDDDRDGEPRAYRLDRIKGKVRLG